MLSLQVKFKNKTLKSNFILDSRTVRLIMSEREHSHIVKKRSKPKSAERWTITAPI